MAPPPDQDSPMETDQTEAGQTANSTVPVSVEAMRMAPYSLQKPSPPSIEIPTLYPKSGVMPFVRLTPSADLFDPTLLTKYEMSIITRGETQFAGERFNDWHYVERREAQLILDFLYLGPCRVIRDEDFLVKNAITMVVVVRDARMSGTRLISVDAAARRHGIVGHYVDMDVNANLIPVFSHAARLINDHMLAIHRARGLHRRGKILVTCDSGNDFSPAIVAAYIMAMYGTGLVPPIQYIGLKRNCCNFNEPIKLSLLSWGEILHARRVAAPHLLPSEQRTFDAFQQYHQPGPEPQQEDGSWPPPPPVPDPVTAMRPEAKTKRSFDDTSDLRDVAMDLDQSPAVGNGHGSSSSFAPFRDVSGDLPMTESPLFPQEDEEGGLVHDQERDSLPSKSHRHKKRRTTRT